MSSSHHIHATVLKAEHNSRGSSEWVTVYSDGSPTEDLIIFIMGDHAKEKAAYIAAAINAAFTAPAVEAPKLEEV